MALVKKKFALLASDTRMGHPELGWVSRLLDVNPDEEDVRYERFLRSQGFACPRVWDGHATILVHQHEEEPLT